MQNVKKVDGVDIVARMGLNGWVICLSENRSLSVIVIASGQGRTGCCACPLRKEKPH